MTKLTNAVELIEQLRQHDAGISRSGVSVTIFSEAANRIEEQDQLREKLADLLTRIAAALKGEPEPNTLHSWHNLPELARAATERAQAAEQDARRYRLLRDDRSNALHLSRNGDHAANYVSAKEWIEERSPEWFANDSPEELAAMKATNTIWTLQIYPRTPVGFNVWNASTLDAAIDAALAAPQGEP